MKETITAHFILNNELWNERTLNFVPRVGDEVRFEEGVFSVERVCWPMDEELHYRSRVNIEIIKVADLGEQYG